MDKTRVGEILTEIALLLELKGENPFKSRAYVNAARTVESLPEPIEKLVAEGKLAGTPGIGEALLAKISELVITGRLQYFEDLKASIPPGLVGLLELSGVGPKKIKMLREKLGVESVEQLEAACRAGRVAELSGFGAKTQTNLLASIERRRTFASKHLLSKAWAVAEPLMEALRTHPQVIRCSTAGSLRRSKEIVGDIDLLASSQAPAAVIEWFVQHSSVQSVQAQGETKASIILEGGLQADLRVVSDTEFPFALAYFTGSKEHNIVMRQRAIDRGLRLNEYGLFRSETETRDPALRLPCRTEDEIFEALGLAFVPPELREDTGEFKAAEQGAIPRLIEWTDLKGSLHNHSTWSDGHQRPDEIAVMAQQLGCAYWGVTDHSKSSVQANGLDATRLRKQLVEIKELNARLASEGSDFRLLTGVEVDILGKGRLDLEDEVLADVEVVVASLHQGFSQSETENTERLINAVTNPYVHILGHLTGRLLLERDGYKINAHAVIDACAATGTWIELNASPYRFDMDWRLWPYARSKGVRCVINCDAHRAAHAAYLRLGGAVARKGWLTREDVVNAWPLLQLRKELAKKREGRAGSHR